MSTNQIDIIDWVAIIGAAAWTPQIISWLYRFFTRPTISLHLYPEPQIGFTTLGPIFNVSFALLSKRKDAILNKISVNIKHESGASYTLDWNGLSEDLSEIQNPLGPTMAIKKSSLPLVVKVLHTGVAQVFVRFQHETFKANFKRIFAPALDRYRFLKNSDKLKTEQDVESLMAEKEFVEVFKLYNSEFIWMAGEYTVGFEFKSPNKFNYKKRSYTFRLSQDDVDELKNNVENIKLDNIQTVKLEILKDYEYKEISWIWKHPEIKEK